MHYCKKKRNLKTLSVLVFIFSCLPIAFIFILLRYIPIGISLIEAYVNSGSSFFIPFIPNINLLSFLPEKGQIIGLTLGQLIDIIIVVNLICYVESSIYHFFKKKYLNEELQEISCLDLNFITTEEKLYFSSQEQEGLFGLENDLVYSLNKDIFDKTFGKTFIDNEEDQLFYYFYNHEQNRKFKNPKRFYLKSKFVSYYYNKNRVSSLDFFSKIKNSYLKNVYSLLIINLPTTFNESSRGGELSIVKTSLNHSYENYLHLKFKINSILNSKLIISRKSEKYGME
ncbi:MAG: hypothetical protein WBH31_06685 [Promethearchaeia archaeon]